MMFEEETKTLYFGYGTYLDDAESQNYLPNAQKITTGVVKNRKFVFRAFKGCEDRGYCHMVDDIHALGSNVHGIVFKHDPKYFCEYPGFEIFFLTVYGDDNKMYECWSLRINKPGIDVRPPKYYWKHISDGLQTMNFPSDYIRSIYDTYNAALPCLDADRKEPIPAIPVEVE